MNPVRRFPKTAIFLSILLAGILALLWMYFPREPRNGGEIASYAGAYELGAITRLGGSTSGSACDDMLAKVDPHCRSFIRSGYLAGRMGWPRRFSQLDAQKRYEQDKESASGLQSTKP